MTPATKILRLDEPLPFYRGGELHNVTIAYETWGELGDNRDNAVLLLTGLSPGAHAASSPDDQNPGWWEDMVGPGKPLDTERFFVICVNSLGSCKGSTGPASINPTSGESWRLEFPPLSLEDVANAAWQVTRAHGINQLDALVGPSMGGMTALGLLKQVPDCARRLVSISSASAATPFAISIRSLQREAIVSDPNWQNGAYTDDRWPVTGMRLARKLGMISYRSAEEWQERFGRQLQDHFPHTVFGMHFAVESYLEAHAQKFIGQFDPCCYLYLSRAMDWFDAADGHDGDVSALLRSTSLQQALVLGTHTDWLFPLHQQEYLGASLREAGIDTDLHALESLQGHDAFLVDSERFGPALGKFLT